MTHIANILIMCTAPAKRLVIALRGMQRVVEAWLGQTAVRCTEGNLKPFACVCVALKPVEACLDRTSMVLIETSLAPFVRFSKGKSLRSGPLRLG